jgi:hypothetical protein
MSPAVLDADQAVVTMTATYVHRHVAEFFRAVQSGSDVQVVTTPGDPIVRVRAVPRA